MARSTAGHQIYFLDPDLLEIIEVDCVTDFTMDMAAKTQLQTTCLSQKNDHTYTSGLGTPSAPTYNIYYDPDSASHRRLRALQAAGTPVKWALAYSNGTAAPDVDVSTEDFDFTAAIADRSFDEYEGYISAFGISGAVDALYTASITVQQSGSVIPHHKTLP